MAKRKSVLQKIALVSAVVSFVLAIVSGVILFIKLDTLSIYSPISASLMASVFFFISVGFVLGIIGKADLPNLKFDNPDKNKK